MINSERISKMNKEEILNLTVDELGLSIRTRNTFKRNRMFTINDFITISNEQKRMRENGGFFCRGSYLTRMTLEEFLEKMKELDILWILEEKMGNK